MRYSLDIYRLHIATYVDAAITPEHFADAIAIGSCFYDDYYDESSSG